MRLVTGSLKHENLHGPWLLLLFSLCTIGRTESKLGRCPSLIDSHPMYCRNNVSACSSDSDCKDDLKCCSDGCARVCVEPRFSACEHRLLSVQQQLTSWDEGEFSLSRPTCKTNGAFEPIQCRSTSEECWCVNDSGFEIAGTRAASRQLVNCSAPKLCSGLMCRMLCPYDFELDERGCPLCQCRDPCSGVKCPGNHECHLEDVDCDSEPCPPVPSCKQPRFMDTVCPSGEPLFLSEKNQPFLCGLEDNQPQCPPFFKCIVQENMEYGSCCPSFEDVDKPGKCPPLHFASECGESCSSDSDCIGLLKCCQSEVCGSHCTASNSTVCEQQKMLAELMSRNEKHNHGYIPQCTEVGDFKMKQCSLNGLVCWCVTKEGKKISHTMGPAEKVICTLEEEISSSSTCDNVICSTFCGYGYKLNEDGCQTCDCEQPCDEFNCPDGTRCLIKPDESCIESFCPPVPTCELVHHHRELSFDCPPAKHQECFNETKCMSDEECTNNSKCCPNACGSTCNTELQLSNRLPTMCEYLRSFALTVADSSIAYSPAYPIPSCTKEGLYDPLQCNNIGECWCVDEFGAELLGTRGHSKDINCTLARNRSRCSGLMCRLGCDYGFKKDDKGCSLCECRNPCDTLECQEGMECQLVEMESFCTTSFCPAIPQCLSKGKSSSQCAVGDPLWNSSSKGYWICGLDNRECPETYVCIKDEDSSTGGFCCLKSVELACNEAKTIGSCDESIQRWHHNNDTGRCERFIYSGCGGNNNNFVSKQACETTCVVNFGISPKNGSCPEISADEIGLCATECLTDGECPGPQKCCLNECEAYVCRDPSGSTGKAGQCPFLISTKSELCDFQCKSDFECEGELKCCSNGCGTSCIEPEMKTACEHQRDIGEYKIRQAGVPSSLVFIPKCQEDGQFFNIQCSIINQTCWCVNDIGMEIPGTRSYNSTLPNCGDPARCPSTQCKITCEYGYELDSQGCALCTCCDPCSDFICTDTEECRLVQVQCATTPCPPIPICLPKIENPCLHGEPLQDEESKNVIKCGPHGMQCPSTHQCHLSPLGEFAVCCPKTRNTCLQPFDSGHCMAAIQRWHFDPVENICKEFQYGGCGGNQNNFQSKEDCEKTCPTLSHCEQLREESLKNMNQNAFIPKCNSKTNLWESVQCLDSIGVCWCVNSNGEEIPGSLVKGQPTCTSRAGRKFMHPTHLNICENTAVHDCSPSTCEDKVCLAYPDAVCRIDPCGGCSVNFYNVSGILVDCNEGLSRCQVELQTVLNSDAWLNERDLMFHLILNDTDSRKSLKKRDLLSGTLSFLKHLMQGIDEDLPKQPLDFLPPKMVEDFSSETSSEDSHSMGVVLPQCLANGDYSPIQMYKSLKWCVTADGEPLHNSLTQRNVKCLSEGKFIQQKSFTSLCDESKQAKVCKTECLNAKCPSHPEAVCEADPCNECSVKFTTKDGKSVNCQTKCLQPVEVGFCRASFRNWFYNQTSGDCEEFIFGGCLGNDNNFESYESCVDECKHPVDVCQLPKETGMCRASMHRWYYNSLTRKCEEFIYGGCDGNQNNFETKEECDAICPDVVLCNQLDDTKKLTACSRQNTCQRKICFGHEDAVCTVDSCNNCNPVFVDLDGVKIKCEVIDTNVTSETGVGISSTEKDAIIMHSKKKTRCEKQRLWAILHNGHIPDCDKDGRFKPMQCDDRNVQELQPFCWCIDEAGNQVQGTVHFIKGTQKCKYMRIMKIEVTLVFSWPKDEDLNANETLVIQALNTFLPKTNIRRNLNLTVETRSDAVVVKFILDDADKVDAADALEEQIKSGQLALILDGHVLYAIHSTSVFRHDVETKAQFENHESLSSGSITVITIITLLTMILICLLIGGVLIYRRKKVGMYPKGSLESLASSTTQLHVYDSKKHLDMSSPLLHNLKCEHDTKKLTVSTVEHEYAVISPTQLDQTKHVVV